MLKCLFYRMMLHLTRSFTVACCTRRFSFVKGILMEWQARILALREREGRRNRDLIRRDASRYESQSEPLVADLAAGRSRLPDLVRQLEALREALHLEFAQRYGGYIRVLENLAQGIDVDALTAWSVE